MSSSPKFWGASGASDKAVRFWRQGGGVVSCGPDLRDEFNDLIQGVAGCEGIGQLMILRSMDKTKHVPGYDEIRGSSSNDPWDQGEIFQWSETYVLGHFTQAFGRSLAAASTVGQLRDTGYYDNDRALVYLMAGSAPKTGDAIFRVETTEDGSAYYPVRRLEKWRVRNVEDRRQERRKVAFYICVCERVEV